MLDVKLQCDNAQLYQDRTAGHNFNPISSFYNSCDMSPTDDKLVQFQVKTTLLQHLLSPRHMICTLVWWQNILQKTPHFFGPLQGSGEKEQWSLMNYNSGNYTSRIHNRISKQAMLFLFFFFFFFFFTNKQKINNNRSTSHIYHESQQQRLNILR